jgi:hypothetical protein
VAYPTRVLVLRFMRIQSYIYRMRAAVGELGMCGLSPRPAVPGDFRCDPHSIPSTIQTGALEYILGSIFQCMKAKGEGPHDSLRETRARHALAADAGRTRHRAAGALPPRRERRPDVIPPVRGN